MRKLAFYFITVLLLLLFFSRVTQATSDEYNAMYAYKEECINEGCNNEEVRELHASYKEECINEGCNKEEVRELAGDSAYGLELYQEFRRRGWEANIRHFEGLDCPHLKTNTSCVAVTLWCNDICTFADGTEGSSGWYICGACIGFDF